MKNIKSITMVSFLLAANITMATEIKNIQLGPRPFFLIGDMSPRFKSLQSKLIACSEKVITKSSFSIGHRGAAMQFPEHSKESYLAAARMGAGILECDVALTKDKQLVCRHSHSDLHTTTNILANKRLSEKCTTPFEVGNKSSKQKANVECRTTDITLSEYKSLQAKMDGFDEFAENVDEYMDGTPKWRTNLYASKGTLMSHKDSIRLFQSLGLMMTPELKAPVDQMPFDGFSYDDYRQKFIDEYIELGVDPSTVYMQSFNKEDILYIIKNAQQFGKQAVYLLDVENLSLRELKKIKSEHINIIAPPMQALLSNENGNIVPSKFAKNIKKAGLKIITWTLERSGHLKTGGGWYYSSTQSIPKKEGDVFRYLEVLAKDVGIMGIFSDWPATVTYYANCFDL